MATKAGNAKDHEPVVAPQGTLVHLTPNDLRPSPNNPRRLFDPGPLESLKDSIREHGVLVPLTVYKLPGQKKYAIVDGERRFRCCRELLKEGVEVSIPANIVDAPDRLASLIYMFNIHQFREQWELMPTARALQTVINDLGRSDTQELHQITGLSVPQIERCQKILTFPQKYQQLSLEEDPEKRIPSNFWVELYPVLSKTEEVLPSLVKKISRDGVTDRLVAKYQAGKIKSVIHFRRVLEAFDVQDGDIESVAKTLHEYILDPELETRQAFDPYIHDSRRFQKATDAADRFMRDIGRSKIENLVDGKDEVVAKLKEVVGFVRDLITKLEGEDPPEEKGDEEGDE
jgi:ParB/RepB/Spo0J family partition protein